MMERKVLMGFLGFVVMVGASLGVAYALTTEEKLNLLEEKFLKGEVSEKVYLELREKYRGGEKPAEVAPQKAKEAVNLVKNEGFEKVDPNNPAKPEDWTCQGSGVWEKGGSDGQYCALVKSSPWSFWTQRIEVKPNTTYRLSAWMKSNKAGASAQIVFNRMLPKGRGKSYFYFKLSTDWQMYSKVFTTSSDCPRQVNIRLLCEKRPDLYFDEISLVEMP